MMQLLFTAYLLLTFTLKHRPYPQLNPERSPVLYLSAKIKWLWVQHMNSIDLYATLDPKQFTPNMKGTSTKNRTNILEKTSSNPSTLQYQPGSNKAITLSCVWTPMRRYDPPE